MVWCIKLLVGWFWVLNPLRNYLIIRCSGQQPGTLVYVFLLFVFKFFLKPRHEALYLAFCLVLVICPNCYQFKDTFNPNVLSTLLGFIMFNPTLTRLTALMDVALTTWTNHCESCLQQIKVTRALIFQNHLSPQDVWRISKGDDILKSAKRTQAFFI